MRFLLLLSTASLVFSFQFFNVDAQSYNNRPSRSSSFKPASQGALLYRTEQLDPELMRRSSPEEVLNKYVKQNQEREAMLDNLRGGGEIDLFQLTSGNRPRSRHWR